MKIWIDKHGGMHYHKEGCKVMDVKHPNSPGHEEIVHRIRKMKYWDDYNDIVVDGKKYMRCPICFGYGGRR